MSTKTESPSPKRWPSATTEPAAAEAESSWNQVELLLTPTAGTLYRIAEVESDPVRLNSRLGYYTNFLNLLDLCAVAVPAGFQREGLPFGVDAFEFELGLAPRLVRAPGEHGGPERFEASLLEGTDGCAALVMRSLGARSRTRRSRNARRVRWATVASFGRIESVTADS